ncbi:MAG: sigma-70 family RNA polymerase sigma factor [Candidatus Eremiobacteraeota bacterium]|nr:sigma-70 family RNA polymerase sigma factor [Candidatus Eremiobacteraeota bacterium]
MDNLGGARTHDTALVQAARAGSGDAFGELVGRYRAPVVRLAYRMTHDADEAKDIAQDAFLRAYRRLPEFHADRPFSRWLFVIARNASLDAIRRRRRATALAAKGEVLAVEPGPEDLALRNDEALRVRTALGALSPKYRDVLELYYGRGLRYREIAVELDIPIGTVKTYISRAKRRLRDELLSDETILAA